MYKTRLVLIYQRPFFLYLLTASKKTSRCDMLKIWKNSYRLSIYVIACPVGFLSLGSGMQKGCKKDFNKNQFTKKFVFQCHTVTHGIDLRNDRWKRETSFHSLAPFNDTFNHTLTSSSVGSKVITIRKRNALQLQGNYVHGQEILDSQIYSTN